MLHVSDMMKSSHVQELQGPSCKLRARSMGTPWAAVDIRWYSDGCYLAPGLDCPVKQFWHGSCPCYYFAYVQDLESLDCRFGGHRLRHGHQGSYGWVPPPPSRLHDCHSPDPSHGETNSRLLHQRSSLPLAPLEARESGGLVFHLRRGDRAADPRARAGENTEGRGLVLSMLPEAGKGSEEEEEGRLTKLGEERQRKRNPNELTKKQLWEGGRGNRRRGND